MNMKRIRFRIWSLPAASIMVSALTLLLVSGCSDDNESTGPGSVDVVGQLVAQSDCLGYIDDVSQGSLPFSQTGVLWFWDGHGTLDLRHANAAFNCCPEINCQITVTGSTITVEEKETGMCDCICLFNVDYQVVGLTPGLYNVCFKELYLMESDQKLEFTVALGALPTSDTVVVDRDHYPWLPVEQPVTGVTEFSDCGGFPRAAMLDPLYDSTCVTWYYDEARTLLLTHQNVVFNCGMYDITANIAIDTGAIWIEERPMIDPQFCLCPFDVEMQIPSLPPDYYAVVLMASDWDGENWVPSGDTTRFMIDLTSEESGHYCYEEVEVP